MRIDILSAVPWLLESPFNHSIIKRAQEKVVVSEVFKWNLTLFGGDTVGITAFINGNLNDGKSIPTEYSLDYYPFDWHLNK